MVIALATLTLALATATAAQRFVDDRANVLTDATHTWIESELQTYAAATGNRVYVEIARNNGEAPVENFGGANGAVLFLWLHEHDARIATGANLRAALSLDTTQRILDGTVLPRLAREDADGAAAFGASAIVHAITPGFENVAPPKATPLILFGRWFMYFAVGAVFVGIIVGYLVRGIVAARSGPAADW